VLDRPFAGSGGFNVTEHDEDRTTVSGPNGPRAVLAELRDHLWRIGSANDAQDHGCGEEAEVMRRESCEGIRLLLAKHGFLADIFPGLRRQVESGNILGGGWAQLSDRLDEHVKGLERADAER
jgi:hypothetical protein